MIPTVEYDDGDRLVVVTDFDTDIDFVAVVAVAALNVVYYWY